MLFPLLLACMNPALTAPEAAAAPGTYNLSGSLCIQVYKDPSTIAAALAHDHIIQAKGWTGTATIDLEDLSTCSMDISVPVAAMVVDATPIRENLGYTTFPKDSEREDIKKEMLSEDQLHGEKYKTITWKSTQCEMDGERLKMTGDLTIRGKTKTLTLPLAVKQDEVSFHVKGAAAIKATDFGFEAYSAGFGALKNQNRMLLSISVHGKP